MMRQCIEVGGWLLAVLAAGQVMAQSPIVLSNDVLEIRLDGATGAIVQVTDRVHGIALVAASGLSPAFRLGTPEGAVGPSGNVVATPDGAYDGVAYDLRWGTSDPTLAVSARIEVPRGSGPARFIASAENNGTRRIQWIEYPVIAGVGSLGADPSRTDLIHPLAAGYRLSDPLHRLTADDRFGFYPDAYGGAPMQMLAYLERGVGGFHFEVQDPTGGAKRLDAFRDGVTGWIEIVFRFQSTDVSPGAGLAVPGPVMLAVSLSGEWEESADRYREWAIAQPWTSAGPLRDRPSTRKSSWLLEQVGVTTFGISVRRDQTAWYNGLHSFLDVPLFHVSGFWWPGGMPGTEWYGGYNDWSLDRINQANLTAIRNNGDRFALFLFPQHFSRGATEYYNPAPDPATDPVAPWSPYAMNPDPESGDWSFICPATTAWQDFFGWRSVTLMSRHRPHGEYLDIGPGLGRVHCEQGSHGHPPGWGIPLVQGARAMLDSRRDELHAILGAYVPRGTEMMSELYLDRFDFYQARAGAGPLTMLEGDHFRQGEIAGWAEKIPLFDYVYHDYAPVRLDGNLKLASQLGALFFWVAGRVVLWGGLPELNYELSALERLPGMSGATWFETYRPDYDCRDGTPYSAASDRATFLQELSDLRMRRGPDFLAYGRMRRGPQFSSSIPQVPLDWHLYNTFARNFSCVGGVESGSEYHSHGNLTVPAVLGTGWSAPFAPPANASPRRPPEKVGLTLAEVGGASRTVDLVVDPARQGVPMLNFRMRVQRRNKDDDRGVLQAGTAQSVAIGSREAVLVRLEPSACDAAACRYRVYRASSPQGASLDASLLTEVTGHSYADGTLSDGRSWYYLVDDGGGYPPDTLRVGKSETVDLSW